jgi:AraC-like DNA-binding protein
LSQLLTTTSQQPKTPATSAEVRCSLLMLGEDLDAASAGFRVGYEDPAYFSRDYKKLFGAPPQRDIARLRSNLEV